MPRQPSIILVVEDSPASDSIVVRSLTSSALAFGETEGISVVRIRSTDFAAQMSTQVFAVVLDDVPPITARDIARDLRAVDPFVLFVGVTSRRFPRRSAPGMLHNFVREDLQPSELYNLLTFARCAAHNPRARPARLDSYRAALETSADGAWDWNLKAETVFYSERWKAIVGYAVDEIGSSSDEWMRRVHPADASKHRGAIASVLRGSEDVFESEYRMLHRDGTYRWVWCRGGCVLDSKGEPHLVGVQRDVHQRVTTEVGRLRSEGHRRHAEKMDAIARLAGGIAHDFNNLLVVILGYSDFVLTHLDSNHPLQGDLMQIKSAGEEAKELTQELSSFSGRRQSKVENLDLCRLVRGAVPVIRRVIGECCELSFRMPAAPITVRADLAQMRQALLHLVVHARDGSPDHSPIELEIDTVEIGSESGRPSPVDTGKTSLQPGNYARILVTTLVEGDAGSTTYRSSRFDPDLPLETPERYGFGLSVVESVIEQVDGAFHVTQNDKAVTSTIFIPRTHATRKTRPIGPSFSSRLDVRTIVLVDDNSMVRSLVRSILSEQGYRVLVASSGEEAMHICGEHKTMVDLLLTDVVMPRVGGRELADRLRAMIPGLPVLYMSGFTGDQLLEHGVSEGRAFIPKPFTSDELGQKVKEVLSGS